VELILVIDPQGLVRVDLLTEPGECEEAHYFWAMVRPAVEDLGSAVQRLGIGDKVDERQSS